MTKSKSAYFMSAIAFAQYLNDVGSPGYLWRFTTREKLPDWRYAPIWRRFIKDVADLYRHDDVPLGGLRVLERHDGGGPRHGNLHYHAVVDKRIPADIVWKIGERYGIGHMEVEQVRDVTGHLRYLAKYLGKQNIQGRGCRLKSWGTIGFAPWAVKRAEIRIVNDSTRLLKKVEAWGLKVGRGDALRIWGWKWAGFRKAEKVLKRWIQDDSIPVWDKLAPLTFCDEVLLSHMRPEIYSSADFPEMCPF